MVFSRPHGPTKHIFEGLTIDVANVIIQNPDNNKYINIIRLIEKFETSETTRINPNNVKELLSKKN